MSKCQNSLRKKMEKQDAMDYLARQQALGKLGITQEFKYVDHTEIINYADDAVDASIETVDARITPPDISIEKLDASSIHYT
jgi:hypothetical protein